MRLSHLAAALLALTVASVSGAAADQPPSQDTPEHWQRLARQDIAEAHKALVAAHPGAIDPGNPGFRVWLEAGPGKALDQVPRVRSYDDMLSVVRFYVAGFHDVHLAYSDDTRTSSTLTVDGWHVAPRDGSAVVDAVAPELLGDNQALALDPAAGQVMQIDCNRHRARSAADGARRSRRRGQAFGGRYGNRSGHVQPTSAFETMRAARLTSLCQSRAESKTKRFPSTQKRSPS